MTSNSYEVMPAAAQGCCPTRAGGTRGGSSGVGDHLLGPSALRVGLFRCWVDLTAGGGKGPRSRGGGRYEGTRKIKISVVNPGPRRKLEEICAHLPQTGSFEGVFAAEVGLTAVERSGEDSLLRRGRGLRPRPSVASKLDLWRRSG